MSNNPIAVFDSGIGSLSVIKELRRELTHENIIYLADKQHFPYGTKSRNELTKIIRNTIKYLEVFNPKIIIIASNTPSIQILKEVKLCTKVPLIGVYPPFKQAVRMTRSKHIGIMATQSTIRSLELDYQIKSQIPQDIHVTKINSSGLIKLIESGVHLSDEKATINSIVQVVNVPHDIDVITLSSTHLPMIKDYLVKLFPTVRFVDPAKNIVKETRILLKYHRNLRKKGNGKIQVMVTRDKDCFQKIMRRMGYTERVTIVSI